LKRAAVTGIPELLPPPVRERQLGERAHRHPNRALRLKGPRLVGPRRAGDVHVRPRQVVGELLQESGRRAGAAGSITAAMFLKEFFGDVPWAHLDIAGTAWADEAKPYLPKGPSGVAVRTLANLAFEKF